MPDYSQLKEKFGPGCLLGEPAAGFTTYRAGGRAEVLVKPASEEELLWLAGWCRANCAAFLPLGRGSNVLVSDKGLPGVTVLTERLSSVKIAGNFIDAQAGALWDTLAKVSAEAGLAGLEKTSGIPGSVGGAVRMNAGAFGRKLSTGWFRWRFSARTARAAPWPRATWTTATAGWRGWRG